MDNSKIERLEKIVKGEQGWGEKERKLLMRVEELEGGNAELLI